MVTASLPPFRDSATAAEASLLFLLPQKLLFQKLLFFHILQLLDLVEYGRMKSDAADFVTAIRGACAPRSCSPRTNSQKASPRPQWAEVAISFYPWSKLHPTHRQIVCRQSTKQIVQRFLSPKGFTGPWTVAIHYRRGGVSCRAARATPSSPTDAAAIRAVRRGLELASGASCRAKCVRRRVGGRG